MLNLSKELCDICKIKPKEDKYCFWECKNPELENVPCNNTKCPHYRHYKYYPDFKQPENFVKLLKIANDVLGGVHFTTAYTKNKHHIFEEQALMHYMPIAKLNNAFQIAIRETKWVYE